VTDANAAPVLAPQPERTIRQGDPLRFTLRGTDVDPGAQLYYYSPMLPAGATLDPETGVFEWTPSFVQSGTYDIPMRVSDGTTASAITATIIVENANAAPVFRDLGTFTLVEEQPFGLKLAAFDPDNPNSLPPIRLVDGTLHFPADAPGPHPVTYTIDGLPEGATFDPDTAQLSWIPGLDQSGRYELTVTATDDGDGTGTPATTSAQF
jgi:hypothetical protein